MIKYYYINFLCQIEIFKVVYTSTYYYDEYINGWEKAFYTIDFLKNNGIEIPEHLALLWIAYD